LGAEWAGYTNRRFPKKGLQPKLLHSALVYLPPARFEAQVAGKNMVADPPQLVA
jgi:hypothetical protein